MDKHICSCEGTEFEQELLRETKGKGVKVILNCLSGHKLQASARCLASHGRFVQLLQSDINSHQTVGEFHLYIMYYKRLLILTN